MRAHRLAVGFIEGSTEWDFDELSDDLQAELVAVAEKVLAFIDPIIIPVPSPDSEEEPWYEEQLRASAARLAAEVVRREGKEEP